MIAITSAHGHVHACWRGHATLAEHGDSIMARWTRKDARSRSASKKSTRSWRKPVAMAIVAAWVVVICVALRQGTGAPEAEAKAPTVQKASAEEPRYERPNHDVMAVVNGQDIRRDSLAHACMERYGKEVLESIVNKRLILHHCKNRNIEVTREEINAEIDRMAKRFKIGREQWLELLEKERGINEQEYVRDILWPTMALRKLAADQISATPDEVQKAYESQFGPSVRARLIIVGTREKAEEIHRQLVARPDEFARLAMNDSEDVNSASFGGLIPPIRRHVGPPDIERQMFALEKGQISPIIPVEGKFAILLCEGRIAPRNVPMEMVQDDLVEKIKEDKLRDVASGLFETLQSSATVQNVWNDPQLRERMPGVAATVNGEQIMIKELGNECLLRYGEEVLEGEISRLLLHQALTKSQLQVSQANLDAEVAHAAQLAGVVDSQGRPNLEEWYRQACEEQGVSREVYMRDSVWPSAALKILTGNEVQVTPQDLQKGFEANYGDRVRVRAIVMGNMRRAQEVWAKARQNPSMEYFGDLAEEYSIEPTSKSLRGEVPPIRKNSGQPQLEEVAYQLKPGELSGITQLGDRYVILKCEGRTEPVAVNFEEVRQILFDDIFEKKLRISMATKYEEIRSTARIDNYLVGTSEAPQRPNSEGKEAPRLDSAVRPTSSLQR
jgi:parvulin-like peptidyl-prolyl isomerase